ncbi:hypothetical protein Tco_0286589 [Tanacetum coccineum]
MSDNATIDEYATKLSGIASKSATLRGVMPEHKPVKKFLTSLLRWFVHIVTALEQVLDLKETRFEDVVGRLKAYEERVKEEDKANDAQENLLYATEYSNRNNHSSKGRGRGSFSRGRGRGRRQGSGCGNTQNHGQRNPSKNREDNEQKGKQHEQCDLSHIKCYRCDQYRHFISRCPEQNRNHEVNLNETQEEYVYHEEGTFFIMNLVQETIFMNEEKYTPPKIESNTEEYDVSQERARFCSNGKNKEQKLLKDIYYIPALRSNVISLEKATISDYDISIRGADLNQFWNDDGSPEDVGHEQPTTSPEISPDQPSTSQGSSPLHDVNSPKHEQAVFGSNDMPILVARLETMRLLIALAAGKGWKIRHLDFKTAFLHSDLKGLDSTLKEMSFLQCVQEKAVYRKVPNGEFIIVAVYVDDLFVRYARKILKEAGMEDCIATLCPMESGLKLSKAEDEPEVEATQYQKMYNSFRIEYKWGNDIKLMGYSDSSHNVDIDEGRSTTGHVFYLGTSPITWCSQKQTIVTLSSCEAEFMPATSTTCQTIWLRELLVEGNGDDIEKRVLVVRACVRDISDYYTTCVLFSEIVDVKVASHYQNFMDYSEPWSSVLWLSYIYSNLYQLPPMVDPPMCQRSVQIIPGLLRSRNELKEILAIVEEKRLKLIKCLIISWVVFGFYVY